MKTFEKTLRNKYNDCLAARIYVSWLDFLRACYETASEKKQYEKCANIQHLICEEINGVI